MLQTYQAELNGSQLIWLEEPPVSQTRERVLVVMERPARDDTADAAIDYSKAFTQARGCMGASRRVDVLHELDQLRSDWERNPIEIPRSNGAAGQA